MAVSMLNTATLIPINSLGTKAFINIAIKTTTPSTNVCVPKGLFNVTSNVTDTSIMYGIYILGLSLSQRNIPNIANMDIPNVPKRKCSKNIIKNVDIIKSNTVSILFNLYKYGN